MPFEVLTVGRVGVDVYPLRTGVGISSTFFLFVAAGNFSFTFVKLYVPETKGRTLETLEAELRARFS